MVLPVELAAYCLIPSSRRNDRTTTAILSLVVRVGRTDSSFRYSQRRPRNFPNRRAWIVGVGAFAAERAQNAACGLAVKAGRILHPSPANPAANRDWSGQAAAQLQTLGVWK